MKTRFENRREAGQLLAVALSHLKNSHPVVLGLPRGGVPVAYEVALALHAPLAVFVVRKLGVPGYRELAMGAIASGGVRVINDDVVRQLKIAPAIIDAVADEERQELERRERMYNGSHPLPDLRGQTVVLVDDGLATGSTMRAAVRAVRTRAPRYIVVAVPVGAPETCSTLRDEADEVVCLEMPEPFVAVGLWYERFEQTTDGEVRNLLEQARDTVPG